MIKLFDFIHRFFNMFFWFVNQGNPWFIRGHEFYFGIGVSVFAFGSAYGNSNGNDSFRVFTMKNIILNKLIIYKIFS